MLEVDAENADDTGGENGPEVDDQTAFPPDKPDRQQPEHDEADRECEQPGDEFPEQQRVAINGLRQDARERAPVEFAIDRIES